MEDEYEDMVLLSSYYANEEELVRKLDNEEVLKDEYIERFDIQGVLKENMISYKNKLCDSWMGRDYKILVEVYVHDIDFGRAKKALEDFRQEYAKNEFNYDGLEGYEGYEEETDEDEEM